jgi:hypothetical protein
LSEPARPLDAVAVTAVWREVFGREEIVEDDNFFAVGGHSIQAIAIARRLQQLTGVLLPFIDVMRYPTPSALASSRSATEPARAAAAAVAPAPAQLRVPLSPTQLEFYLVERMTAPEDARSTPYVVVLEPAPTWQACATAVAGLLDRHELLRTLIAIDDGRPVGCVVPADALAAQWRFDDLTDLPDPTAALQQAYEQALRRPFDLEAGPILGLHVYRLVDRAVVLFTLPHIAADGFSTRVLARDFTTMLAGGGLPPLPLQYRDHAAALAAWIDGPEGESARAFWRAALRGYRRRPIWPPTADGSQSFASRRLDLRLPRPALERATGLAAELGTTLFGILQAALNAVLHHDIGLDDLVVGSPVTTREGADSEGLVGPYLNTLPLRVRLHTRMTFRELVAQVDEARLAAFAFKQLPLDLIRQAVDHDGPLFDVGLTLQVPAQDDRQPRWDRPARGSGLRLPPSHSESLTVPLWIVTVEDRNGLSMSVHFRPDVLSAEEAASYGRRFCEAVERASALRDATLDELVSSPSLTPLGSIELDLVQRHVNNGT